MIDQDLYMLNEKFDIFMNIDEEDKKRFKKIISWTGRQMELSVKEKISKRTFPKRGEIWTCNFGENVGSEINGVRPAVILQNNVGNLNGKTTIVAPITSREERQHTHVSILTDDLLNLEKNLTGTLLSEQIQIVSKARLGRRIARFSDLAMNKVEKALLVALGFSDARIAALKEFIDDKEREQGITSKSA
ncbi:type II toxin-antitoxin system PemK/MazF family toxin (plasmid) [Brevibacillus halotolerans]|nr:type II toxin-antitoxin system PemK/MazF family toxin [Brevibacillus halotolerans]